MKKYSFLVYQPEYNEFLKDIQNLGVLHVIEKQQEVAEEIKEKYRLLKRFDETIKFLQSRGVEEGKAKHDRDGIAIINEVSELISRKDNLLQNKASILKEASQVEPWGEFSLETIEKLKEQGIFLSYFTCPAKKYNPEWVEKYDIQEIDTVKGLVYFIVVSKVKDIDIEADPFPELQKPASELRKEADKIDAEIEKIEKHLDEFAAHYIGMIELSKSHVADAASFDTVIFNTASEADDKIMVLEGWVPETKVDDLDSYLNTKSVFYLAADPEESENVPILLKNSRFARMFEPIGKMFMNPVYSELDLVPFFAPFFLLFFGFCLGDAGYGLIFVIGATIYKFKASKAMKSLISLVQILGISTIIFGAVSGTFFGMNLIDSGYKMTEQSIIELKQNEVPAYIIDSVSTIKDQNIVTREAFEKQLISFFDTNTAVAKTKYKTYRTILIKSSETNLKPIKNFRYMMLDPNSMFKLALLFGVIQIIFGMMVRVLNVTKQKGFKYSLPVVGWLIGILGGTTIFILFKQGVITNWEPFAYGIGGVWAILLLGFSNPKNIFASIGAGIGDIYFTVTGFLGDLLSYIRLFALGLSSAILGFVFNDLALQLLNMNFKPLGILFFVILLLFGHSINIFLSALGSFVHPMRLTFVEFYKNAGFTGGGKDYKPFEYKIKN
ncbi:MAG: hypothetical protein JXB49_03170 [Bacteroidales bacterium]|nr:hypothetical protein [Bacteroidales bacterium]